MRVSTSFLLAAAATGAMAQDNSTCFDGLYIVVVRGTNEEPGPGLFGGIANRLAERVPGSEVLALEYPASLTNPIYAGSVRRGGEALKEAIEEYNDQCPEGRMVVLGYSQGAQVSLDALCGGREDDDDDDDEDDEEDDGRLVEPISADLIESNVIAMVMFGDPTHHSGASYNAGTANTDGLFDRDDISACEALGPALVSYCDTGDIYCNRGRDGERDDLDVHGEYFEIYDEEVLDFVLSRYEGGSGDGNATITRPEATGDDDDDESAAMAVGAKLEYLLPIGLASLWMLM